MPSPPQPPVDPHDPPAAPPRQSVMERQFPTVMKYSGLVIAMYEAFVARPPQYLIVVLAAVMMAGARVLEDVVNRRGL